MKIPLLPEMVGEIRRSPIATLAAGAALVVLLWQRLRPATAGGHAILPISQDSSQVDLLLSIVVISFLGAFVVRLFFATSKMSAFFVSIVLAWLSIVAISAQASSGRGHFVVGEGKDWTDFTAFVVVSGVVLMFYGVIMGAVTGVVEDHRAEYLARHNQYEDGGAWAVTVLALLIWTVVVSWPGTYLSFAVLGPVR
jgi:hypothetical protein